MTTEIRGKFGWIEGKYKKAAYAPNVLKPCEHWISKEERLGRPTIIILIHGQDDGKISVKEHKIGSGVD